MFENENASNADLAAAITALAAATQACAVAVQAAQAVTHLPEGSDLRTYAENTRLEAVVVSALALAHLGAVSPSSRRLFADIDAAKARK